MSSNFDLWDDSDDAPKQVAAKSVLPDGNLPKADQLFILPDVSNFTTADIEAIEDTFDDMVEMGIAHLPYRCVDVIVRDRLKLTKKGEPLGYVVRAFDVEATIYEAAKMDGYVVIGARESEGSCACGHVNRLRQLGDKHWVTLKQLVVASRERGDDSSDMLGKFSNSFTSFMAKALIVFLGTKNVTKVTRENKLVKFGIGKQKHRYVTSLKVGHVYITEHEKGEPTGRTMRAHLRRGHIRRQRYGPELTYEKKVWIEPVFVNSDREYIPREAYNVSGMSHAGLRASDVDIQRGEGSEVLRPSMGAGLREDKDRHPDR